MFGNDPQCRAPNSGRRKVWSTEGIKQPLQMDCRQSAVIKPVQSFIMNVPGSVSICTEESALDSFFNLSVDFGSSGMSDCYDPWVDVDLFNRTSFSKKLTASYKNLLKKRKESLVPSGSKARISSSVTIPSSDPSAIVALRGSKRLRSCFGSLPKADVDKTVKELQQGSSKE